MLKNEQVTQLANLSKNVNFHQNYTFIHVCYDTKNENLIYVMTADRNHEARVGFRDKNIEFVYNIDGKIDEIDLRQILEVKIKNTHTKSLSSLYQ